MKNLSFLFIVVFSLLLACSGKKDEAAHDHEEATNEAWKEMDDFHMVMAEAFHPYKDSANLEPAKNTAASLSAAAATWAAAPAPEKENMDKVKEKLKQLESEAAAFAETVKAGDDKLIAENLTKLHDLFHEIQEEWYGGHEGHQHDH